MNDRDGFIHSKIEIWALINMEFKEDYHGISHK